MNCRYTLNLVFWTLFEQILVSWLSSLLSVFTIIFSNRGHQRATVPPWFCWYFIRIRALTKHEITRNSSIELNFTFGHQNIKLTHGPFLKLTNMIEHIAKQMINDSRGMSPSFQSSVIWCQHGQWNVIQHGAEIMKCHWCKLMKS